MSKKDLRKKTIDKALKDNKEALCSYELTEQFYTERQKAGENVEQKLQGVKDKLDEARKITKFLKKIKKQEK